MTVPGIGLTLATVILLQIGSTERFASAGNFASYARCVERQYLINGKKKGEGNPRNGNKYLACVFVEAANFALRFCDPGRH
jgi:transposase